ncbi:hyaluronan and proteoglycan link protein 1 [Gadus morhua]|uniref:Hyaluronan and proteoglycan link protein 1-like n=1 Tax=Gadus morhua TaxID=8049 RepID=A0A8C4ZDY0_GADMO|nr:hyaluronan and proteoglycan link protein 1-like [Gadus morhua]
MLSLLSTTLLSLTLVCGVYSDEQNATQAFASAGANVTLPCRLNGDSELTPFANIGIRVKWSRVPEDETLDEEEILVSLGIHTKSFGEYNGRAFLQGADEKDASLTIMDVTASDSGRFRCEVFRGMEEVIHDVTLLVEADPINGVVFPYSPRLGRYNLNFHDAEQACLSQHSTVATFDQLFQAWRGGFDWCNAGWLNDGTVQYPVTKPREPCGGSGSDAGLRSYGQRDKSKSRYDVFCFKPVLEGTFYWLEQPERLTFDEAVQACLDDNAEIATVGHMYAAWKLHGYDRCDAGWLADSSVRYPISRPRKNCSAGEAAVRFLGFPDKKQKLYGVYCFKPQEH